MTTDGTEKALTLDDPEGRYGIALVCLEDNDHSSDNAYDLGHVLSSRGEMSHLITACPTCKQSFLRHTNSRQDLETLDVLEALAATL